MIDSKLISHLQTILCNSKRSKSQFIKIKYQAIVIISYLYRLIPLYEKIRIQVCVWRHRIMVQVGDAGFGQHFIIDKEIAGTGLAVLCEDPVRRVGDNGRLPTVFHHLLAP